MTPEEAGKIAQVYDLRYDGSEYNITIGGAGWDAADVKEVLKDVNGGDPEQVFHDQKPQEHGSLFTAMMYSSLVTRREPFHLKKDGKALLDSLEELVKDE
ncbi:MAG: hypothetical protein JRN21_09990 [Nitrososphaerota archaeon]|nr:hypothetical protein [Nitrososphaerota archaeon]